MKKIAAAPVAALAIFVACLILDRVGPLSAVHWGWNDRAGLDVNFNVAVEIEFDLSF